MIRRSTKKEIKEGWDLAYATRAKIKELLQNGKKVHIIWDFDGVLADGRSDDIFTLTNFNLKKYFAYEERLLSESPGTGQWLLGVAHSPPVLPHFPQKFFSQDIITARSSTLAIRVHVFCLEWKLKTRWMLFIGHQNKKESYRIILKSFKSDPDQYIFCVDDNPKHIESFRAVSIEEEMESRTIGIVSPTLRTYSKKELKKHYDAIMKTTGNVPIRVRDTPNDSHGFIVLPRGVEQFREQMLRVISDNADKGHYFELRNAFIKMFGEVGCGRFKTEEELERAMKEFIVGIHCS